MPRTGTRKLIKDKNKKTGELTQFCIDGYLVKEVLDALPSGVRIIGAQVHIGKAFSKCKLARTNKLKQLGVSWVRETMPTKEVAIVFDVTTKKTIQGIVDEVSEILKVDKNTAYFKYLTLSNTLGTGKFVRTTKEIHPDDKDLRKKLTVLGLTDADGRIQSLIADISAKKYVCTIQEIPVRTIICARM